MLDVKISVYALFIWNKQVQLSHNHRDILCSGFRAITIGGSKEGTEATTVLLGLTRQIMRRGVTKSNKMGRRF